MSAIAGPSSVLGLIAALYMLYIFALLSRKLGNVTKMKPHYRGLYLSMALTLVAIVAHVLRVAVWLNPTPMPQVLTTGEFYLVTYYLPLTLAVTISLVVVVRYWGWLFSERDR
ncbi:MAG TPA: hypothetical protein VFF70_11275 [Anaerolineae bacterium]|jgi:hypothetical protein|nr:hypothetical protein [Anaerolineae bacterium]